MRRRVDSPDAPPYMGTDAEVERSLDANYHHPDWSGGFRHARHSLTHLPIAHPGRGWAAAPLLPASFQAGRARL